MDRQPSSFASKIQNPKSPAQKIQNRPGFTLVEMLVVIVIILILVGLLAAALGPALVRGHEAVILTDITGLDSSMKAFKERYNAYPPSDMTNLTASGSVAAFLQKAFPRCNVAAELNAIVSIQPTAPLSPAQALVFWLSGFSGDPEHPITGRLPIALGGILANNSVPTPWAANATAPLTTFDQSRLLPVPNPSSTTNVIVQWYVPSGHTMPYVYFASQNYFAHWGANYQFPNATGLPGSAWNGQGPANGNVRPYLQDNGNLSALQIVAPYFANPSSFQIISAGVDDDYGAGACSYSSGVGGSLTVNGSTATFFPYATGDKDNLTNFSGKNLGDSLPQP